MKDFVRTISRQRARYIRILADNYGKLPSWHPGSGSDAWIFVDEIIVERRSISLCDFVAFGSCRVLSYHEWSKRSTKLRTKTTKQH